MKHHFATAAALAMGVLALFACDRRDETRTGTRDQKEDYRATDNRDGRTQETGQASEFADKDFLTTAAQSNLAEVAAGRLAVAKASNADVKEFGQHMIDDHTQANSELTDLARKKGIPVPTEADDAHKQEAAKLAELSGDEFDRKYMAMMVTDHVKAVSLFENNVDAKDEDVRAFAEKLLPKLQEHLKTARELSSKVGSPTAD